MMLSPRGLVVFSAVFIAAVIHQSSCHDFTEFQKGILEEHNKLRRLHGADPLLLDQELCNSAQAEAEKKLTGFIATGRIAQSQSADDNKVDDFNDNTLAYRSFSKRKWTPSKVVDEWASQGKYHNWQDNYFNSSTGHFSQMIWCSTEFIGVGEAEGRSRDKHYLKVFVVRYTPPGNILDRDTFVENVLPPITSTAKVTATP